MVKVSMPAWRRRHAMPMPPKPDPMIATRGVGVPGSTGGASGPGRRAATARAFGGRSRPSEAIRPIGGELIGAERTDLDRAVKRGAGSRCEGGAMVVGVVVER